MNSKQPIQLAWWAVLVAAVALTPVWGQQGGAGDAGGGTDQPPEEKVPPKIDVTDIRNSIGNLDMVRGFNNLATPPKPGWLGMLATVVCFAWRSFHPRVA